MDTWRESIRIIASWHRLPLRWSGTWTLKHGPSHWRAESWRRANAKGNSRPSIVTVLFSTAARRFNGEWEFYDIAREQPGKATEDY